MEEFFNENMPQELSQPLNYEVVLLLIAEGLKRKEHVRIRFYYDYVFIFVFEKITQKPLISNLDAGVVYHFLRVKNTFFKSVFP